VYGRADAFSAAVHLNACEMAQICKSSSEGSRRCGQSRTSRGIAPEALLIPPPDIRIGTSGAENIGKSLSDLTLPEKGSRAC
jgi:hypothetical protein